MEFLNCFLSWFPNNSETNGYPTHSSGCGGGSGSQHDGLGAVGFLCFATESRDHFHCRCLVGSSICWTCMVCLRLFVDVLSESEKFEEMMTYHSTCSFRGGFCDFPWILLGTEKGAHSPKQASHQAISAHGGESKWWISVSFAIYAEWWKLVVPFTLLFLKTQTKETFHVYIYLHTYIYTLYISP